MSALRATMGVCGRQQSAKMPPMADRPLSLVGRVIDRKAQTIPEKMREMAERDLEETWNRLKAIAGYGDCDTVRLRAIELMLAHMVGKPVAVTEIKSAPVQRAPIMDLSRLTDEELRAYRTLTAARERLSDGADLELPVLPPIKIK